MDQSGPLLGRSRCETQLVGEGGSGFWRRKLMGGCWALAGQRLCWMPRLPSSPAAAAWPLFSDQLPFCAHQPPADFLRQTSVQSLVRLLLPPYHHSPVLFLTAAPVDFARSLAGWGGEGVSQLLSHVAMLCHLVPSTEDQSYFYSTTASRPSCWGTQGCWWMFNNLFSVAVFANFRGVNTHRGPF